MHYAFLYVTVNTPSDTRNIELSLSSDGPITKAGGAGLHIVPRNTKSIIVASSDYMKTQSKVIFPWYGFTSKKVSLQKDKNADKVAYLSMLGTTCATYMPKSDQLAYYDCLNPKTLVRYEPSGQSSWAVKTVADFDGFSVNPAQPFLGGLLGISYLPNGDNTPAGDILAISADGKSQRYPAPTSIPTRFDISRARLFTDTNDPADNHFVIAAVDGTIYIGTISGSNVQYDAIAAPSNYNKQYNQTLCTLGAQTVYCYRGPTAYGDAPTNFDYSKVTQSQITTYSLADGSVHLNKFSNNLFALSNLYVTANGNLFAKNYYQLYHFTKSGDTYRAESVAQSIMAAGAGDRLYYIQNNAVYAVDESDPTSAYQIFYSPNITPKAVYPVGGKTFIIGTQKNNGSTTYAYSLNSQNDTTPGSRLIDLLPLDLSKPPLNAQVYSSDLVGDTIYVTLSTLNLGSSATDFNNGIAQEREAVTDYLSSHNLITGNIHVTFNY